MSDLLRRRGIVKVSDDLIREAPEKVLEILKNMLIVRVDNDFVTRSLTYTGYSAKFDISDDTETVPVYVVEANSVTKEIKWHREKEYSEQNVKNILQEIKEEIKKFVPEKSVDIIVEEFNALHKLE